MTKKNKYHRRIVNVGLIEGEGRSILVPPPSPLSSCKTCIGLAWRWGGASK